MYGRELYSSTLSAQVRIRKHSRDALGICGPLRRTEHTVELPYGTCTVQVQYKYSILSGTGQGRLLAVCTRLCYTPTVQVP